MDLQTSMAKVFLVSLSGEAEVPPHNPATSYHGDNGGGGVTQVVFPYLSTAHLVNSFRNTHRCLSHPRKHYDRVSSHNIQTLPCPPALVPSFNDEVNFFKFVLAHITTEYPTTALAGDGVPSVHRTAPHISDPVGVDGRVGTWLRNKGIVRGHLVSLAIHASPIDTNPQHFPQQRTSERQEAGVEAQVSKKTAKDQRKQGGDNTRWDEGVMQDWTGQDMGHAES